MGEFPYDPEARAGLEHKVTIGDSNRRDRWGSFRTTLRLGRALEHKVTIGGTATGGADWGVSVRP